jgi:glycosyltransferase involved in cell wall biosynthesis
MPVYNGARFIDQSIASIRAQTLKEFVLLIADNASTDDTEAICRRHAAEDTRIRYVRHRQNIGAPGNWNYVLDHASGAYFKWATANDTVTPEMLALCAAALDEEPAAVLAQGKTILVDEDSGAQQSYAKDLAILGDRPSQRLLELVKGLALNNGQSGIIRLDALKKTRKERSYPNGDVALMAELALHGTFVVLPQPLLLRKMGATTFARMLTGNAMNAFYGGSGKANVRFHAIQLHLDILRSAIGVPETISEKVRSAVVALRYAKWKRGDIAAEIGQWFRGANRA